MRKPVPSRAVKQDRLLVPLLFDANDGNVDKVAAILGRCNRFVLTWSTRARRGVGNAPGAGRPRKLVGEALSLAKRLADGVRPLSSPQIAQRLKQRNISVHPVTVLRSLNTGRSPVRFLPVLRRHRLTAHARLRRFTWAQEHRFENWDKVMFTDSHIYQTGGTTARKRLQRVNRRKFRYTTAHGLKIHIYAGLSIHGLTKVHFVSGTTGQRYISPRTGQATRGVQQEEYHEVIRKTLVPEGQRLFRSSSFTVLQDGAPCHTARGTRTVWSEYPDVSLLQAAPKSPDLNLIENIWSILDSQLDGREFRNIRHLKAEAERAWRNIPLETCQQLVDSMQSRLQKVMRLKGGHIERNIYS